MLSTRSLYKLAFGVKAWPLSRAAATRALSSSSKGTTDPHQVQLAACSPAANSVALLLSLYIFAAYEYLLVEKHEQAGLITLNRPKVNSKLAEQIAP
jgi:hypothetical protein